METERLEDISNSLILIRGNWTKQISEVKWLQDLETRYKLLFETSKFAKVNNDKSTRLGLEDEWCPRSLSDKSHGVDLWHLDNRLPDT